MTQQDSTIERTITDIMTQALAASGRPGEILSAVARLLRPKSGEKAMGRRKLNPTEARAAATCITSQANRLGVSVTEVCRAAKVAAGANNYRPFHLNKAEFSALADGVAPERKFSGSIHHYHRMVVELARLAAASGNEVDVAALLDEMGEALADFLQPWVPQVERSRMDKLADHLNRLGAFFARPQRAADGTLVDLPAFFGTCETEELAYDDRTGRMAYRGEEPQETWARNLPRVMLFPHVVGKVPVDFYQYEERVAEDGAVSRLRGARRSMGQSPAFLVYVVSLCLTGAPGQKVRARFLLEPWTVIGRGPRSTATDFWLRAPELSFEGFPFTERNGSDAEGPFKLMAAGAPEFTCAEYTAWLSRFDYDEHPDVTDTVRVTDVTPETCETFLSGSRFTGMFDYRQRWASTSVLPPSSGLDGRAPSGDLADRLAEVLYRGDETSLDQLLLERAAVLVRALDEHVEQSADAQARREAAFLRRMRG